MYLVTFHRRHTHVEYTVKSNWADTGVGPLILPYCALINSRGEILCSDAFTLHLWTPHTLSSQPNFHHQTQRLIRLTRIWGRLLYACVRVNVCGPHLWHALRLGLCFAVFTQRPSGGFQPVKVSSLPGCCRAIWLEVSVAAVVRLH